MAHFPGNARGLSVHVFVQTATHTAKGGPLAAPRGRHKLIIGVAAARRARLNAASAANFSKLGKIPEHFPMKFGRLFDGFLLWYLFAISGLSLTVT